MNAKKIFFRLRDHTVIPYFCKNWHTFQNDLNHPALNCIIMEELTESKKKSENPFTLHQSLWWWVVDLSIFTKIFRIGSRLSALYLKRRWSWSSWRKLFFSFFLFSPLRNDYTDELPMDKVYSFQYFLVAPAKNLGLPFPVDRRIKSRSGFIFLARSSRPLILISWEIYFSRIFRGPL